MFLTEFANQPFSSLLPGWQFTFIKYSTDPMGKGRIFSISFKSFYFFAIFKENKGRKRFNIILSQKAW